ncbi:FliH/SctL family protein [Defluviitalea phaphyphila]|uniref:FliH/SctL family protein n=1 Tax=Defluviitalea phaphyphila TaxID=1473580 RepID=UPI000731002F|nr:FliH/SctL family protein [Defluviitalea phaphyphila]
MSNIIKNLAVNLNQGEAVYIDIQNNNIQKTLEDDKTVDNLEKNIREDIILKAKEDAKEIILEAEKKAALILDNAKKEAENIKINIENMKKEAKKKGYEEGFKRGAEESEKLCKQAKLELDNAIKEKERIIKDIEPKMVELILDICEKILGQTISINKKSIFYLIRKGFVEIQGKGEKITIKVSNDDYKNILEFKEEFMDEIGFKGEFNIIKDPSLKSGDCIIESDFGNIDCSLGTQFQGLKQELLFLLGS